VLNESSLLDQAMHLACDGLILHVDDIHWLGGYDNIIAVSIESAALRAML
jgi:hypothetical protein